MDSNTLCLKSIPHFIHEIRFNITQLSEIELLEMLNAIGITDSPEREENDGFHTRELGHWIERSELILGDSIE